MTETLVIAHPPGYAPERRYILSVVLEEFLGLRYEAHAVPELQEVQLRLPGDPRGKVLIMSDMLFHTPAAQWLHAESLPKLPLATWSPCAALPTARLNSLPILYGLAKAPPRPERVDTPTLYLPLDIFGSAFFMLTRYEEAAAPARDRHERYPASASVAYRAGFLDRPLIDEYVEILGEALWTLWPGLPRKRGAFRIVPTHDVDRPYRYLFASRGRVLLHCAALLLRTRTLGSVRQALRARAQVRKGLDSADPFYALMEWLMDMSEKRGLRSTFYFLAGRTGGARDGDYDLEHPRIRRLLRRVHERGHEIGLHASYHTCQSEPALRQEFERLVRVCRAEGIEQARWGSRQHFLRWRTPHTFACLEAAGLAYDTTLAYADHAGFRCGTCQEYPAFDLAGHRALKLRERPLIAMDCSLLSPRYQGLSHESARRSLRLLADRCRAVQGNFVTLWHNSSLTGEADRALYRSAINAKLAAPLERQLQCTP